MEGEEAGWSERGVRGVKKRRYNIGRDTEEGRRVEKDGCNTCTESGVGG